MSSQKWPQMMIGITLVLLLLVGCSAPAATQVLPTAKPTALLQTILPTAKPAAATATSIPPTVAATAKPAATAPAAVTFKTVTIGAQVWMAENLNVDTFANGEAIPEAKTKAEWDAAYKNTAPAWSYYNNDPANGPKYGRLYNWYAVNDPRGLAPAGWHVPTDQEWTALTSFLGGENTAAPKMKSAAGWKGTGSGSNSSGFNGLPGGERLYEDAAFYSVGEIGFWWSATKNDQWNAWYRALHYMYTLAGRDNGGMNTGFSVRLLKD